MRLISAEPTSDQWDRGRQLISELNVPHTWNIRRGHHMMWLLEADEGGTFDEVTEQVTGRPLAGVIVATSGYISNETLIAVHPNYQRQRWGYRMMNHLLSTNYETLWGEVDTTDTAAMAFASHYGTFQGAREHEGRLLALVQFWYNAPNWQHANCRCTHCIVDLNSLNAGPRRRRR